MADQIVAEYTVKVDKALKDLEALAKKVDKVDTERKKTEDGFSSMSKNLTGQFAKVGAALGLAFGAQQVVSFTKEVVNLAAQSEGVERAFKRIGNPQILADLRKATRGTVSDLQLMQNAVKASNFKIPLENLASLFKFAQARARETGESVDYLVDSIILGIGRKSPLILDNLGISAIELKSKLNGVGLETASVGDIAAAVGTIATESLKGVGEQADTTADKIAQISTAFENFKVSFGKELISQFSELNAEIAKTGQLLNVEGFDGLSIVMKGLSNAIHAVLEPFNYLNSAIEANAGAYQLLREILGLTKGVIDENIDKLHKQAKATVEVKAATEDVTEAQKEQIKNVFYYQQEIKKVVDEIGNEATAINAIRPLREKEKQLRAELAKLLGEETDAQKKLKKQAEETAKRQYDDAVKWKELQDQIYADLQALRDKSDADYLIAIDTKFKRDKLYTLQTVKEAEGLSDALLQIEQNRIIAQIEARKGLGMSTIDLELDLAALRSGIINEQDMAYEASIEHQIDLQKELQDQSLQQWNMYASAVGGLMNSLSTLSRNLTAEEIENLEIQLNAGQITREEYDEKRRAILERQAEQEKTFNIFNAIINGASAVVSAFNDGGPVLAAIVAAAVAAEIAIIASTPTPKFAKGVIDLKGKGTGTSDSIEAKLSKGESVMTAEETKKHKDMFTAIRKGGWEKYKMENIITPAIEQVLAGGFEGMGASYMLQNNFNDKNLLKGLDRMRTSEKDSARFIVQELKHVLKPRKRGGYA